MNIISFVGMPGSGKSEASKIALDMNIPVISMGDIIREEAKKMNINQKYCGKIADYLRKSEGKNAIAKRCVPYIILKIINENKKFFVIDGIRSIDELNYFEELFNCKIIIIFIDSNIENRFKRILSRKREDDFLVINDLKKRDDLELKWGIFDIIKKSHIIIKNNTTFSDY